MRYEILKDFKGSQDGRFAEDFKAGTERDLSDWLVSAAPPGAIRPVQIENKAIITDGAPHGKRKK